MQTLWPSPDLFTEATAHQREMYALATSRPVGILGGNPGAGKTHTSAQVIKEVVKEYGPSDVAVACATGKAAVRITEAMLGHGLRDVGATTIHRLLKVSRNGHDQNGWGFLHNKSNPLLSRFLFIDESSMLGCSLFSSLLSACPSGMHILSIGDFAQLPPVEHGAPLRDMIAAGLPYGELTEIHRNAGDIVRACAALKEGKPFTPSAKYAPDDGLNLIHREAARPAAAVASLRALYQSVPKQFDPTWDIQVLCAMNDASEVSRKPLNTLLQSILNPGVTGEGRRFRLNDKVICLTNAVMPVVQCPECMGVNGVRWELKAYECDECFNVWKTSECLTDFVANGEIGKVVMSEKGIAHVAFDSPKRTVRVAGGFLDDFDLAYCVTCHKAQGSQWPVVIMIADDGADRVTSWEWWRTAFSRSQTVGFTIGRKATIDRQCRTSALKNRKTFLTELLKGVA
jgi:exodeoxyribonuclease V alpha subunit